MKYLFSLLFLVSISSGYDGGFYHFDDPPGFQYITESFQSDVTLPLTVGSITYYDSNVRMVTTYLPQFGDYVSSAFYVNYGSVDQTTTKNLSNLSSVPSTNFFTQDYQDCKSQITDESLLTVFTSLGDYLSLPDGTSYPPELPVVDKMSFTLDLTSYFTYLYTIPLLVLGFLLAFFLIRYMLRLFINVF